MLNVKEQMDEEESLLRLLEVRVSQIWCKTYSQSFASNPRDPWPTLLIMRYTKLLLSIPDSTIRFAWVSIGRRSMFISGRSISTVGANAIRWVQSSKFILCFKNFVISHVSIQRTPCLAVAKILDLDPNFWRIIIALPLHFCIRDWLLGVI